MIVDVSSEKFNDEVINSSLPVLVDFWAPWCGPCKIVAPHLERLAESYGQKIKVCKVNVDEAPEVATQYSIMSIPTLLIFKNGNVMEKRVGAMAAVELEKFIRPYL